MFADQLCARDPRRRGLHRCGADGLWKDVGVRLAHHSGKGETHSENRIAYYTLVYLYTRVSWLLI